MTDRPLTWPQANRGITRPRGGASHRCPKCRASSRVLDTRALKFGIQRIRTCTACHHKFITRERAHGPS